MAREQDRRISDVVEQEQSRLRSFIRRRVPDPRDVEDILQDVFYELVEANRLLMPIEHVTGWLFRVARNRITDLFREETESFHEIAVSDEDVELLQLEDLLPSPDAGPEAVYARNVLLDELAMAVDELPADQRSVRGARIGRPELQGDRQRDWCEREHAALAQTLCGAASAPATAKHLRRIDESIEDETEMDFHRPGGSAGDRARDLHRRRSRAPVVELAAATARLAPDRTGRRLEYSRCADLFGGFGRHGGSRSHSAIRRRMADRMADRVAERWERMTPEERERPERIRERCGFDPATSESRRHESRIAYFRSTRFTYSALSAMLRKGSCVKLPPCSTKVFQPARLASARCA